MLGCPSFADFKQVTKMNCYNIRYWSCGEDIWIWTIILKGQDCTSMSRSSCEWCHGNPKRIDCNSIKCWFMHCYYVCDLSGILDHSLKPIKLEHATILRIEKFLNKRQHWKEPFDNIQMIDSHLLHLQWSGILMSTPTFQGSASFHRFLSGKFQRACSQSRAKLSHFTKANIRNISRLPFQEIPTILIWYFASETAEKLNLFPPSWSSILLLHSTRNSHQTPYRL